MDENSHPHLDARLVELVNSEKYRLIRMQAQEIYISYMTPDDGPFPEKLKPLCAVRVLDHIFFVDYDEVMEFGWTFDHGDDSEYNIIPVEQEDFEVFYYDGDKMENYYPDFLIRFVKLRNVVFIDSFYKERLELLEDLLNRST